MLGCVGKVARGVAWAAAIVMAGAVIFTWLFNNTRGSVLLVMLFHSFINMWIEVFPAPAADQAIAQALRLVREKVEA